MLVMAAQLVLSSSLICQVSAAEGICFSVTTDSDTHLYYELSVSVTVLLCNVKLHQS